jgi:PAS domain S-box-containing protein
MVTREVDQTAERSRFRELLHRVTAAANQARSAEDALAAALREICEFKGWPLAHVYLPANDGSGQLVPTTIWHPAEPVTHESFRRLTDATRFDPGKGLPGRVLASRGPAWIPDVTKDRNFPRAGAAREHGLAAAFGFPARSGDDVVAVLEFFTTDVLPPEPRFLETLDEIGAHLGEVLRRQGVEATLRQREAQLAQAQSVAKVGSWEIDVLTDRVTWSDELFRIYGLEPGAVEVGFAEFLSRIHVDDRAMIERKMEESLETGAPFQYEYRIIRPDGSVRVAQSHGRAARDADGRVIRLYGASQDITERKAAEEALRENEQRYRFLADYSTDMITVYTPEGTCTFASPAARSIMGYAPGELLGRPASEFIHPNDLERVAETRLAILRSFATRTVVCRLRRKTGAWIWAETTSRGVRDPVTGMVESIVAVTRDVTGRVRAERAMHLLQRVAAAANEATTVEAAIRAALRAVCEHSGWTAGHVYVPSSAAGGDLTPSDIWHLDAPERFEDFRAITRQTPLAIGQGLPGEVLVSGSSKWIVDLEADPSFLRKREAAALGLKSAFAFPIKAGDETLAVLEFFATETYAPDADLTRAIENVGAQLGQVLRRQRVEAALKAGEVRFRALAETANDGIVTIDDQSRIVYTNPAVTKIFGYEPEDLLGKSLEMLMPQRFRSDHRKGLKRYLETGLSRIIGQTVELMGLRNDGMEVPIELSIAAWSTGDRSYFTGIIRDITARKQAEGILTEKMDELSKSNAELALFTYVASHDLREPLRTVASNVQLIERRLKGALDEGARRSIRFALEGAYRMQALIDDLLAYSRVGTEAGEFESVDSAAVLDEVVENLRVTIEAEEGEVTRGELPIVWVDRIQLAQVFQNLVANAIKFHREKPPRVHISAERREEDWLFSVRDEGIGFEPDFAEHVFTIFQRLHSADEFPGTGIGLAICRKIVERHGGRIWAESEPDKGSVFHFTIPIRDGTRPRSPFQD